MIFIDEDFLMMLVFVAVALAVISMMRRRMNAAGSSNKPTTSSAAKPQSAKEQIAEDIKSTKTSQVSDAVAILDDLTSTSNNYRHYCELVGSSMASGGVIAPYSRRQVAYYDIKCYRLDATYGGGQKETLVAHEHSIDPFFFTDASCDTPVYVDLESFGDNVILVNSTNHVEGPNSDFAKAFQKNATTSSSAASTAFAMVARTVQAGENALLGAGNALRRAFRPAPLLQPALATAAVGVTGMPASPARHDSAFGSNIMFDHDNHKGRGGGRPQGHGGPDQRGVTVQVGNTQVHMGYGFGPTRPPQHLNDFMGGYGGGPWVMGGGNGYARPTNTSAEVLLGMGLGALLNSMAQSTQPVYTTTGSNSTDTFRGYRLVENVVPLSSPIYCIGEIYRSGKNIYMSRSLAKDYPTSYFATKPESEVLSAISS